MKKQKTKIITITGVIIAITSIAVSTGILYLYRNEFDNNNKDSFCQDCPPITNEELAAGWYFGFINQKKPGTPAAWVHVGEDTMSARWVNPDILD